MAVISCFWKLWLEALERGFQGDQGQERKGKGRIGNSKVDHLTLVLNENNL
jgi:hypothetical protein